MRFQELSIYDQSHADYKDYQMRQNCRRVRPIYDKLFPYVRSGRKEVQKQVAYLHANVIPRILNVCTCDLKENYRTCRTYMTNPENIKLRQGFVSFLAFTGFHFGNRQNHFTKKLFFGTLGALIGGVLCFPTETDVIVRQVGYFAVTNLCTALNIGSRAKHPVKTSLPDWPVPSIANDPCSVCRRNLVETRECYIKKGRK